MPKKSLKTTAKASVKAVKQKVTTAKRTVRSTKAKLGTELKKLRSEYKELRTSVKDKIDSMELDQKTRQLKKDVASQMREARTKFADFKDTSEDKAADVVHGVSMIMIKIRRKLAIK